MKITPFRLERYFAQHEFSAPYLLCSSDCEAMSVGDLLALAPDAAAQFNKVWLGYTETQGHPDLRDQIIALYQAISPDQILVHTGAEEAIFTFLNAVLSPGDHVIAHAPGYQSHYSIAEALGAKVTRWETQPDNGWDLDLDFLQANIRPATKAILVNCPHNPTGYLMSHNTQQQLIKLARHHNLLLFSDEVYRGLEYDPANRLPAAADLYENAVSLGVMSKTYGLAGLRIGWIATRNSAVYQRMVSIKDYTSICNSAPSEFLATLALHHRDKLVARNLGIIRENLALLDDFFARFADVFDWQRPIAGSIAFPRLKLAQPITAFCRELIEKQGVMLAPDIYFDFDHNHFRIGFGRKNMPAALQRLENHLREMTGSE